MQINIFYSRITNKTKVFFFSFSYHFVLFLPQIAFGCKLFIQVVKTEDGLIQNFHAISAVKISMGDIRAKTASRPR